MTSAIAATGLRKSFGGTAVLDGIDLEVAAGTTFSLLGPNGAGKAPHASTAGGGTAGRCCTAAAKCRGSP